MKTIKLITATFILISISATSQITKGNFMVGGNALFSQNQQFTNLSPEKYNSLNIQVITNGGYFFINNLAIGAKLGYEGQFVKYATGFNYNTISYGVFTRY